MSSSSSSTTQLAKTLRPHLLFTHLLMLNLPKATMTIWQWENLQPYFVSLHFFLNSAAFQFKKFIFNLFIIRYSFLNLILLNEKMQRGIGLNINILMGSNVIFL